MGAEVRRRGRCGDGSRGEEEGWSLRLCSGGIPKLSLIFHWTTGNWLVGWFVGCYGNICYVC